MKKTFTFILLSMLCVLGYAQAPPQHTYNFSQVCSSGQMLYYRIVNYSNNFVEITYPGTSTSNPWNGYTKPTGNITLPSTVSYNGVTYTVKAIDDYAFMGCSDMTGSLTIPNSVTSIGNYAFRNCNGFMGSLIIRDNVTSIGNYAFYGCSGFTGSLTIPISVTSIGNYAFYGCNGFTGSLSLGNNVTSIGNYAFRGCANFSFIIVRPMTPPTLGSSVFYGVPNAIFVYVPCGSLGNYQAVSQWNAFPNMLDTCDPLTYSINEDGVSVTVTGHVDGTEATGQLIIPDTKTINGVTYAVTAIGDNAFYGCSGFTGNLTIPNSVTRISNFAFSGCVGFTGLTLGNSVDWIGIDAFSHCIGFTGSLIIPNSVTLINADAFWNCTGFTGTLTLGNSLTNILGGAFEGCSGFTGTLTIPSSVTYLAGAAFRNCTGFTQVRYNAINCSDCEDGQYYPPFEGCHGTLTIGSSVQRIPACMFYGCSGFTGSLTIPNSVTSIGQSAFKNCTGFTQVKYNAVNCANVTYETEPFEGCTAATLTIGTSVQRIPAYMFYRCSNFTGSLNIPSSVTELGVAAFRECTGFNGSLTLGSSVASIGDFAFYQCNHFTGNLTIPNSVTSIGNYAFGSCTHFVGSLTIPNSVTTIGNSAFSSCSSFTGSLTIGNSVTTIGGSAFYACRGFTGDLTIPNSVTEIGGGAFYYCIGFTGSLTLGNGLLSIGNGAFESCNGFTGDLIIPNSLTSIGLYAFYGCAGFNGMLTIGPSVNTIGTGAFKNCTGLTSMTVYPETPPTLGTDVFQNVPKTIPVYVPCGSLEEYQAATSWSDFTNMQCIPETLTVYDGTYVSQYVPANIFHFDDFTRSQFVIPAADLSEMTGSPIVNMTFYTIPTDIPCTTESDADVYLKEVFYTNISDYEPKETATTVYSGRFNIVRTDSGGEMTIHFSTPYYYQGGNLLVGIENTQDNGRKSIFFFGRSVNGSSISDFDPNSLENVQLGQRNFIPKTTFGFRPSCEAKSLPYTYDFEEEDEFGCWTMLNCTETHTGISSSAKREGNYGFQFYYNSNPPQYLISPKLECPMGVDVSFYYKNISDDWPETFQVGYSTTTKLPNAFTWRSEVTANDQNTWMLYEDFFPEGTKYVAVKLNSYDQYCLFLDDFNFSSPSPLPCHKPIGLETTDITSNTASLSWMGYQDAYDIRYRKKPIFFEDFENGLPSDWTTIDNDGDGYNWFHSIYGTYFNAHSGTHLMASESWHDGTVLSPDNWLVTPLLQLQGTMKVWLCANSSSYQDEHFAIYLSTSGNSVSDFTTVLVPETVTSSQYVCYFADLSAYAGQQGYIAIRHFNCSDMDRLRMDDFGLFDDPDDTGEWETVYDVGSSYTLSNLGPNTAYEWQVRGINTSCEGGVTEWSAIDRFITECGTFIVDATHPFTEGFEGKTFAPKCWEAYSTGSFQWLKNTNNNAHSGSASAYSYYYGDNYLVMPDIELSANASAAQLTFWSYNDFVNFFVAGNNTVVLLDGDTETVLWSAETVSQEWEESTIDLSAYLGQTVSLAFKYAGNDGNDWFVDDVMVSVTPATTVTQTIELSSGWNWISTYIDLNEVNGIAMLKEALGDYGVTIQTYNESADYFGDGEWSGLEDYEWTNAEMVMVEVSEDCTIALAGPTADPSTVEIEIHPGWNWIGFPVATETAIGVAMAGFEAEEEDAIQSNVDGTSDYLDEWLGDVLTLVPGQGYMYYSNSTEPKTLVFQTGHDYVDLGLPSGTLWATCNVGAEIPEDYGDYFAWGETQPKNWYDWSTYQYCNGSENTLTKYCSNSSCGYNGFTDDLTILLPEDDAATANWGGNWRMPTKEEWQELYNNTTMTWTTQNGVSGMLFTASNGNSLFLPAAGCIMDDEYQHESVVGLYWSSSLSTDYPKDAWYFYFEPGNYGMDDFHIRYFGQSVRPVRSRHN